MSQFLRGLLGVASGAGQGYFRGKAMQADEQDRQRRAGMEEERLGMARANHAASEAERQRREDERKSEVSGNFKEHLRNVSMGARHGGMLDNLMRNPDDEEAANTLLRENPQMLSQARTELGRRQPEPVRPPPNRTTNRGIEEFRDGEWAPTGLTPYRAPERGGGGGGSDDPSQAELEAAQGRGIIRAMGRLKPDEQAWLREGIEEQVAANPRMSREQAAYRVMQGVRATRQNSGAFEVIMNLLQPGGTP